MLGIGFNVPTVPPPHRDGNGIQHPRITDPLAPALASNVIIVFSFRFAVLRVIAVLSGCSFPPQFRRQFRVPLITLPLPFGFHDGIEESFKRPQRNSRANRPKPGFIFKTRAALVSWWAAPFIVTRWRSEIALPLGMSHVQTRLD